ncbi:MAG TPA: cupin domain-containing protein [Amycolatopsis sp.]|uniref:cupin domain-containing protein n=1 Tax=Amycolatopsis sp. TaxID=37632 RepID=UPI002F40B31E
MPLHVPGDQVHEEVADMGDTSFSTQAVYGNSASLMFATRPPGYHSKPHRHDCEQLNLLRAGAVWVFIEDRAFHLKAGDFLRIPAGAVHWAWNKSDAPCEMVEVHSPGLQADPTIREFAVGLFDERETPALAGTPVTEFVTDGFDAAVVEKLAE